MFFGSAVINIINGKLNKEKVGDVFALQLRVLIDAVRAEIAARRADGGGDIVDLFFAVVILQPLSDTSAPRILFNIGRVVSDRDRAAEIGNVYFFLILKRPIEILHTALFQFGAKGDGNHLSFICRKVIKAVFGGKRRAVYKRFASVVRLDRKARKNAVFEHSVGFSAVDFDLIIRREGVSEGDFTVFGVIFDGDPLVGVVYLGKLIVAREDDACAVDTNDGISYLRFVGGPAFASEDDTLRERAARDVVADQSRDLTEAQMTGVDVVERSALKIIRHIARVGKNAGRGVARSRINDVEVSAAENVMCIDLGRRVTLNPCENRGDTSVITAVYDKVAVAVLVIVRAEIKADILIARRVDVGVSLDRFFGQKIFSEGHGRAL